MREEPVMKTKDRLKDQKGIALVVALIMLLVLTFIGLAAISTTSYEARIAGNERVYNNAFYAGDGGIENFRGRASTGEFVYSVATSGSYQVAIGDCCQQRDLQEVESIRRRNRLCRLFGPFRRGLSKFPHCRKSGHRIHYRSIHDDPRRIQLRRKK